jgi:uncharacterized protein (TIGR03437 family)
MANGGTAPYLFDISSGALPPGLTFASPQFKGTPTASGTFTFTVRVTDSAGNTASAPGSIVINPASTDLILSDSTVEFDLTVGSTGVPTPASVTVRSSAVETQLNYTVTISPDAPWLDVRGGGTTPDSIHIALNSAALQMPPATTPYQTTVTAVCTASSTCAGRTKNVVVSLQVSAPAPRLVLTNGYLSFVSVSSNPAPLSQDIGIQNVGGGSLTIYSSKAADPWISVANLPNTLAAGPAVPFTVVVNPAGLRAGYYTSSVTISSSAGPITLPVNLQIATQTTMQLAPSGAQFSTTVGTPLGNPNGSFAVGVNGAYGVSYTASVVSGSEWLSLVDTQGSATFSQSGTVRYAVNPSAVTGNTARTYYGIIRITSTDVVNSQRDFEVVLDVAPAGTPVMPELEKNGLLFAPKSGANASNTLHVYASSTKALTYQSSAATADGGKWLTVSPAIGAVSATSPAESKVSVDATGLAPGVYRGGVSYAFSSAAVRTVNVTLLVGAGSTASVSANLSARAMVASASCSGSKLVVTRTGMAHNFQQPAGWPVGLSLLVTNDCGTPVTDAQVTASFSNGDAPVTLRAVDNKSGIFAGTWVPNHVSPQVTITAAAFGSNSAIASAQITGQVATNSTPLIYDDGVQHIFRPEAGGPLAPGSAIAIYGLNLATATQVATPAPLPNTIGGTTVLIGGVPAPLYYISPGQINAQVPFELAPDRNYEVRVMVNGAVSAPASIALLSSAPGIAAFPTGAAIAQHADYTLVSDSSPVRPGEYVILYLAGMGATDNAIASGAASPSQPLAHPLATPVVTINGQSAEVSFAGLTPGCTGLYQINLRAPSELADGPATLLVAQAGPASNPVTLPVKR